MSNELVQLQFNDPAPDLWVRTAEGKQIRLSSLWAERPLVLVFTRHFGCTQCKEMLDQFVHSHEDINKAGLDIASVMQGSPEASLEFCKKYAPNILCLSDPERELYHAYGLGRGNFYQTVLSPEVIRSVMDAGKKGYHLESPPKGQDAMQMSGIFIIGTDGRIRLPYYYDNIADHPTVNLLLSGVLSTGWDKPFTSSLG